jgi:hypothetical protein
MIEDIKIPWQGLTTLLALAIATACLFVRTVFRSVELSAGFSGHLANSEVQFMVLDGVMVLIASACLTIMHPGIGFANKWAASSFKFRTKKVIPEEGVADSGASAGDEKPGGIVSEEERGTTNIK